MRWPSNPTGETRDERRARLGASEVERALRTLIHKLLGELKDLNEAIEELGYCCEVREFIAQRKENCNDTCCAHIGGGSQ